MIVLLVDLLINLSKYGVQLISLASSIYAHNNSVICLVMINNDLFASGSNDKSIKIC